MGVKIYASDPEFHERSYEQGYEDGGNSATEDCHSIMFSELGADIQRLVHHVTSCALPVSPAEKEAAERLQAWLDFRA